VNAILDAGVCVHVSCGVVELSFAVQLVMADTVEGMRMFSYC
jgi:hypothetical protein